MSYGTQPMPLAARNPIQTGHGMVGKPAVGGGAPGLPERDGATLDLDFTKGVLDPRITFTRASAGTRVGPNGLIESIPTNVPRFDHDPITCKPLGLLIEEQRTNIALQSNSIATGWNYATYTVVSSGRESPDGLGNATEVNMPSTSGNIRQTPACSASTAYTFSFWAKSGTAVDVKYSVRDVSNAVDIVASTSFYASINSVTYTRVSVSFTTPVGCLLVAIYPLRDSGVTGTVFIWGAQLQAGAFPTSYIPTTSAAVVRYADVATMNLPAFRNWHSRLGSTVVVEYLSTAASSYAKYVAALYDGTASNRLVMFCNAGGSSCLCTVFGTAYNSGALGVVVLNENTKVGFSYSPGRLFASRLGSLSTFSAPPFMPILNKLGISEYLGASHLGVIKSLKYWPFAKTPQQLKKLTT
jgi:hypothetical protein